MIRKIADVSEDVLQPSKHGKVVPAELLEQLVQHEAEPYVLSSDERTAVREAMDRAAHGEFADGADVHAILRRQWG